MSRVFIFLHGAEKETFLKLKPQVDEPIICADSGIQLAMNLSYAPEKLFLIGDLDSVSKKEIAWCRKNNYAIQKYPIDKDYTDGELAFQKACTNYDKSVEKIILGGISSLLDHTLGNILSAVPFFEQGHNFYFLTENQRIYFVQGKKNIHTLKGCTISIIPLKETRILHTKGLQWEIKNESFQPFQSRSLRNKALQKDVELQLKEGLLLLIESWEN